MNQPVRPVLVFASFLLLLYSATVFAARADPVVPNPSTEAKALLKYLYKVSGKQILTGQNHAPLTGSARLVGMHQQIGLYPAIFGQDFGFGAPGSWDGINFRQQIVDEAIRRHREGFIITLMWHALIPTQDEPGTLEHSVQTRLSDEEWHLLLTPGSPLNERWQSQVDVIAWHLKQLQYARVPVLWRPYHEMNEARFWWGARPGPEGYAKLYRMLFERLTQFHKLNNLVWVFNGHEVRDRATDYRPFYPGHDVVDVLATSVYGEGYDPQNYQQLLALAEGKPIALGEVGALPTAAVLTAQPMWAWFMARRDPDTFSGSNAESLRTAFHDRRAVTLDELPWVKMNSHIRIHYPILQ